FNGGCNAANACFVGYTSFGNPGTTWNINGTAWTAGNFATINNIGAGSYYISDSAQGQPNMTWKYAKISNLGDGSNNAIDYEVATNPITVLDWENLLFNNNYRVWITGPVNGSGTFKA